MFRTLIANEIARRGISVREAARQIGFTSHGTLVNVLAGRPMEVETAHMICKWLGVPLTAAVEDGAPEDKAIAIVSAILKAAPELEKLFVRAAEEVETGNLTVADFKEILDFIAFKLYQGAEHNREVRQAEEQDQS